MALRGTKRGLIYFCKMVGKTQTREGTLREREE
jgi:hypothetical protein